MCLHQRQLSSLSATGTKKQNLAPVPLGFPTGGSPQDSAPSPQPSLPHTPWCYLTSHRYHRSPDTPRFPARSWGTPKVVLQSSAFDVWNFTLFFFITHSIFSSEHLLLSSDIGCYITLIFLNKSWAQRLSWRFLRVTPLSCTPFQFSQRTTIFFFFSPFFLTILNCITLSRRCVTIFTTHITF